MNINHGKLNIHWIKITQHTITEYDLGKQPSKNSIASESEISLFSFHLWRNSWSQTYIAALWSNMETKPYKAIVEFVKICNME